MNKIAHSLNITHKNHCKEMEKQPAHSTANKSKNFQGSKICANSLPNDTIHFTGLNRNLSKMAYASIDSIKKEVKNFPKSKGIVGNLPAEWIQKIPKENRANVIKELYGELNAIVRERRVDVLAQIGTNKRLSEAFSNAGITQSGQKISILYIGEGELGTAFRLLGLSDDKYIIKIFHPKSVTSNHHGKHIEPNRAAFWQKYAGKNTQMAPFYFADLKAGYMVNKFIDDNTPKYKRYILPQSLGLKSFDIDENPDAKHNIIKGFQIDYGGLEVKKSTLVKDKKKQADFRKFFALPKEKQLESLHKADDSIKMHVLDNIILQSIKARTENFNQLLKNASEEVKIKLACKIYIIPDEETMFAFKQLLNKASDKVKIQLATNLPSLPRNARAESFKLLLNDSSEDVKKNLVYAINFVEDEQKAECYNLLAENASPELSEKMAKLIGYVPKKAESLIKNPKLAQEEANPSPKKNRFLDMFLNIFKTPKN